MARDLALYKHREYPAVCILCMQLCTRKLVSARVVKSVPVPTVVACRVLADTALLQYHYIGLSISARTDYSISNADVTVAESRKSCDLMSELLMLRQKSVYEY